MREDLCILFTTHPENKHDIKYHATILIDQILMFLATVDNFIWARGAYM